MRLPVSSPRLTLALGLLTFCGLKTLDAHAEEKAALLTATGAPTAPADNGNAPAARTTLPEESQRILDSIKPGEWYEVPDSHLADVAAPKSKFPWLGGSSGIAGIICCWAGGAYDWQRDQLIIGPAGGHNGYNGNEVYTFKLSDMKWHRLTDPYPIIHGETCDPKLAPFAMHTYDGVEYLPPPIDRYIVIGGWDTPDTYALNLDQPEKWEVYPGHGTGRTGDTSGYDPVNQVLYFDSGSNGKMSQYDPFTHKWTLRANDTMPMDYSTTGDIDHKRGLYVAIGGKKMYTWSIGPIPMVVKGGKVQPTGDTEIIDVQCPGLCYAPLLDKFVAWKSGVDVYTYDPDTKVFTKVPPAATNKVIPDKPDQWGTYGRWRYVASQNLFILYNSVKQNVYLYRLTADKPNVITGVKATLTKNTVDSDLQTPAISVEALYADGSKKIVTEQANYFALDPAVLQTDLRGKGNVLGVTAGAGKIRVVYTDPAFKRGFEDTVSITVKDSLKESTLEGLNLKFNKLTLVAGDSFTLEANGAYAKGADRFAHAITPQAEWKSDAPDTVSVAGGVLKALKKGGPVIVSANFNGKSDTVEVSVVEAPVITRINFQVKEESPREGWQVDTGKAYSDARGYGWVKGGNFTTRDDRANTKNFLLKSIVSTGGEARDFKVKVPEGWYNVRVAMGDPQYGAVSFGTWTALNGEKFLYYSGKGNDIVTRVVKANADGLVFNVFGSINYIVVAPVGVELDKYANDGVE